MVGRSGRSRGGDRGDALAADMGRHAGRACGCRRPLRPRRGRCPGDHRRVDDRGSQPSYSMATDIWRPGGDRAVAVPELCRLALEAYRDRGADDSSHSGATSRWRSSIATSSRRCSRSTGWACATSSIANSRASRPLPRLWTRSPSFPAHLPAVDPQAIYNYVYFHMVPGPDTVYRGWRRVPAGHCVIAGERDLECRPYWRMRFRESGRPQQQELAQEFRSVLRTGVAEFARPDHTGTFLSGGTDSSTVTGVLAGLSGAPVPTFSIGFDASGYDEMEYARIAARRFATSTANTT